MNDRDRIAELLREAEQAHHHAFRHVNGVDAEWPSWYAGYLVQRLSVLLRRELNVDALARALAAAEAERRERVPEAEWSDFYAGRLAAGTIA